VLFTIDPRNFQAVVEEGNANFEKAEQDLKRQTDLLKEAAVSRQDYDNAISADHTAKAALDEAQLNLEFTKIVSPIDGIAGIAAAQIGDLVGPGSGVLTTVSTLDPIKVYFSISEQSYLDFRKSAPGQPRFPEDMQLELILADGTPYPLKGKFFALDRQIDATTGTLRVAGLFPNPDTLLRPGQYARVRAAVRTVHDALEVPQRAVNELQGAYQVWVVDGENLAHVRDVKVGERVGPNWIIAEGLKPGERIIVEGLQKAKDGGAVTPKLLPPVASAAPAGR
jgi:RND family efflux transporter MFP subunit